MHIIITAMKLPKILPNSISGHLFFKIFLGGMPLDPLYSIAIVAMQFWTVRGPTSFVRR